MRRISALMILRYVAARSLRRRSTLTRTLQVSPYNLWSVRFVRYATVILTILTSLWWAVLLVSAFVTPPGVHVRGSSFLAFSYTTVAFVMLIVLLLSFAAPSQSAGAMIIISAVGAVVHETHHSIHLL
jgi:hypothetical protein